MNMIQLTPRPSADIALFEPLTSLSGLRPGDSIEQTGPHAARLFVALPARPADVGIRCDGRTLLVVGAESADAVLRRFELDARVAVSAARPTADGIEIDFVRHRSGRPAQSA